MNARGQIIPCKLSYYLLFLVSAAKKKNVLLAPNEIKE